MLIYQMNLNKKYQASIMNSTREIDVSIYLYITALCSLTDRLMDKSLIENIYIHQTNLHKRKQTDIRTYGRTFVIIE